MPSIGTTVRLTCAVMFCAARLESHTLPISDLTLVASDDYLHLELSLNPEELSARNATNDLAAEVIARLQVRIGETTIAPETTGATGSDGNHHLRIRAHYPVKNFSGALSIESSLTEITGASHFTQVTFRRDDTMQLARLDNQTRKATFRLLPPARSESRKERGQPCPRGFDQNTEIRGDAAVSAPVSSSLTQPSPETDRLNVRSTLPFLFLALLPMSILLGTFLFFVRDHSPKRDSSIHSTT